MQWMDQTIELDTGETVSYFDTETEGDTLLFIHGNLVGGYVYKGIEDHFKEGFRTIVLNLPGFGKSSYHRRRVSYEDWAADVISFIKKLHLDRVHLVGVEGGAAIAQEVVIQIPDLIQSLHLISPVSPQGRSFYTRFGDSSSPVLIQPTEFRQHPFYGLPIMKALVEGDRKFFKRILTMTYYYIHKPSQKSLQTQVDAIFSNRAYFDALSSLAQFNITSMDREGAPGNKKIKKLNLPIFIYYGKLNRYLSLEDLQESFNFYPKEPVLDTYPKSATLVFHDQSEEFFSDFYKNIHTLHQGSL